MSPIIRECINQELEFSVLHTGQHYSNAMDKIFFEQLDLSSPTYYLDVGSGTQGAQTAAILAGNEKVLLKHPPEIVLVQGDTKPSAPEPLRQ
jgi:UDP-N-acetylglucosamine 2-epimerase (non-hydrolysing)